MKSNTGLVEYAKKALSEQWGYVWGTFGQLLTDGVLREKLKQYPDGVGNYEDFIRTHWLDKKVTDCVGLIKSYMWWSEYGLITYDPKTDVSADQMYEMAFDKGFACGNIETIPEIPGICVRKNGHIGVYIGNGQVIEARGTKYGVIKSSLTDNNPGWTHWLKCPFIAYDTELSTGSKGNEVLILQNKLNKLSYHLNLDGDFGPATLKAVLHFQSNNNLKANGVVDKNTMIALEQMVAKLESPRKTFEEIARECSEGSAEEWITKIDAMEKAAEADGDTGAFEFCKYLKAFIVKVYYHK